MLYQYTFSSTHAMDAWNAIMDQNNLSEGQVFSVTCNTISSVFDSSLHSFVLPHNVFTTISLAYNEYKFHKNYIEGTHNIIETGGESLTLTGCDYNYISNSSTTTMTNISDCTMYKVNTSILRNSDTSRMHSIFGCTFDDCYGMDIMNFVQCTFYSSCFKKDPRCENDDISYITVKNVDCEYLDFQPTIFPITVSTNSKGEVKYYCEADLIA